MAKTFSEPAKLESLSFHPGDTTAVLTGTSLDQVKQVDLKGLLFTPSTAKNPGAKNPGASESKNELTLAMDAKLSDPKSFAAKLNPGDKIIATATLKDGRTLTLPVTVSGPRPVVTLLSKGIEQSKGSPIHLSPDDVPLNQKLTFFLKSVDNYPREQEVEVASTDDSLHVKLSIASGTLVLQNKHTVLATLEPLKVFGTSAFGPLHVRAVAPDGTTGDWIPLATLVRLPTLTDLHCPAHARQQPCTLEGSDLYLVESFSIDPEFTAPVTGTRRLCRELGQYPASS